MEQVTDDDGRASLRLSERGAQLGRAFAMAGDDAEPAGHLSQKELPGSSAVP